LPLKFLAIAQSVLVQLAINHGLGRMEDNLVHSDFVLYQKVTFPQAYSSRYQQLNLPQVRIWCSDTPHCLDSLR
jgi:hypothetical protein